MEGRVIVSSNMCFAGRFEEGGILWESVWAIQHWNLNIKMSTNVVVNLEEVWGEVLDDLRVVGWSTSSINCISHHQDLSLLKNFKGGNIINQQSVGGGWRVWRENDSRGSHKVAGNDSLSPHPFAQTHTRTYTIRNKRKLKFNQSISKLQDIHKHDFCFVFEFDNWKWIFCFLFFCF